MSESALWKTVKTSLAPFGRIQRIENRLSAGIPDVAYVLRPRHDARAASGWIELKYLPSVPNNLDRLLKIRHLTAAQALWLAAEANAGGHACMILHAAEYYFVFPPSVVILIYNGRLTWEDAFNMAAVPVSRTFQTQLILQYLTREI